MSKFTKLVIALILILLVEGIFIYLGYVREKKTNVKPLINYDKPIVVMKDFISNKNPAGL